MKNNTSYSPIKVNLGELKLNVFKVGASPLLRTYNDFESSPNIRTTHTHFAYEIFFVTSGCLKIVTNNNIVEYKNSIIIIPQKFKHFSVPIGGESYCLLFSFDESPSIEEQLNKDVLNLPINEETIYYIKKFTEKTFDSSPSARIDENALARLIFNGVFRNIKTNNLKFNNKKSHASQHINAIENYINKNHLFSKLTLTEVANAVHLSPKQVARIIKKEYGYSFSTLVIEKKLAVATIMLENTDMRISEIAHQTFGDNEKYFYRVFKSKYGITPLKYRENLHSKSSK